MATPNANLGISASFDATAFQNAIKFAMQMGAPNVLAKQAVFVFKSTTRTYSKNGDPVVDPRLDRDGVPLDPEVLVTEGSERLVKVDAAIEIEPADPNEMPVGNFRPTKALVTLLDAEFALVDGCDELRYNGDRYAFGYEPGAFGLFNAGIHQLTFYALDES